jgi:dTDP-4-amino-4,6-dideoxygalactose transaminase
LLAPLEEAGLLRRPIIPADCAHNAHMYYILLPTGALRDQVMAQLKQADINAVIHYVPLHNAPAGLRFGRAHGALKKTTDLSARLLRLPLWIGLGAQNQERIADAIGNLLKPASAVKERISA